jgi:transcriptional regulator with XRE-family HTH domain
MDIMDTARLNIKKHRELKGLRQQDMADKLNMNIRSYQHLENGETKLDIERLERIAGILETTMEELLRPEGYYFHQEIGETRETSSGFVYHFGIEENILNKLLAAKDDEIKTLKDEIKYLKEKVDQLLSK